MAAFQPTRRETRICLCLWGKLWFRLEHDRTSWVLPKSSLVSLGLATHVCKDKSSDYQIVPWTLNKSVHWLYFECLNFFIWYNVDEIHVNILWIFSEFILILWLYHSWLSTILSMDISFFFLYEQTHAHCAIPSLLRTEKQNKTKTHGWVLGTNSGLHVCKAGILLSPHGNFWSLKVMTSGVRYSGGKLL